MKIAATEILMIGLLKLHPITRGTPDIRSDADVTARGQGDHGPIEGVDRLRSGPTMRKHDPGAGAIAPDVVGNPHERADDLAVETAVVDQLRRWNPLRIEAG